MLFLLLQMKLRTVVCIFMAAFILFILLSATELAKQWLDDEREFFGGGEVVDESIFQAEVDKILSGQKNVEARYPDVPVMVWWTPFSGDVGVQECGPNSCFVTNDASFLNHPSAQAVFFYGTNLREVDLPLPRRGIDWALLHEESPKNNQLFSHEDTMVLFNHTSTFRIESDLPLTTQYLEGLHQITSQHFARSVEEKNRLMEGEGLAPVVYVQSGCDSPLQRDLWVQEFMKYVQVDSYGACLHNKDLPANLVGSEQMENKEFYSLLSKYKFMLTLENAECPDYVTEKFWRAIELGVVPIYLGAHNIRSYLPNRQSAIVISEHRSVDEVAILVNKLNKDDKAYNEYLEHKTLKKITNSLLKKLIKERGWGVSSDQQMELGNSVAHFQCLVCSRLHQNNKHKRKGFGPVRYKAKGSHYGCPVPTTPLTKEVDKNNWYVQEWQRTKYASATLREWVENRNDPMNASELRNIYMEKWKNDLLNQGAKFK